VADDDSARRGTGWPGPDTAWLVIAAGDDRQHGGNDGYDDEPSIYYSWDSTVANSRRLAAGDPIVLWDKRRLLGASVIEQIDTWPDRKLIRRCPACRRTGMKPRATKSPRYRCQTCKHEFDSPVEEIVEVTAYRSRHDAAWLDLFGVMSGAELRQLCGSPRTQHSLRSMSWGPFIDQLSGRLGSFRDLEVLEKRSAVANGGHVPRLVRVRLGQPAFRQELLGRFGSTCAITGTCPPAALEAAHLYSYAKLGEHHEHGGLLLRRDLHRLFDAGQVSIDPDHLTVAVADELRSYPDYWRLHGRPLHVRVGEEERAWLRLHRKQHRSRIRPDV
jgi:hypothetical protein